MEIENFRAHTMREGSKLKLEESWTPCQRRIAAVVTSLYCEATIASLVVTSFVLMILEADYGQEVPSWLDGINHIFLVVYVVEVVLKIYVYTTVFFTNFFNVLDLAVVFLDLASVVVSLFFEDSLPSLSALRIFRMLRLARGVKVMMQLPQLALIVKGMMNGISAALYGVALLLIILTVWGVVAVQFIHPVNSRLAMKGHYDDCARCHIAFATVRSSMLTFIQQIIAGDSWGEVTIPIIEESPATALFFAIVFITVHFTIMNVILAVIVDTALRGSQQDVGDVLKHKLEQYKIAEATLLQICNEMDKDGSGDLTCTEIVRGFDHQKDFRDILVSMDIKKDDMKLVFDILDSDHSGTVNYEEFITELFRMKKYDPHTMLVFIKHYVSEIRKEVKHSLGVERSSSRLPATPSQLPSNQNSHSNTMLHPEDVKVSQHVSHLPSADMEDFKYDKVQSPGRYHNFGRVHSSSLTRQMEEKEQRSIGQRSMPTPFPLPVAAGANSQRVEKDNNIPSDSAALRELGEQLQSLKQIICDDLLISMKEMTQKAQRALHEVNIRVPSAGADMGGWVEPRLLSPDSNESSGQHGLQPRFQTKPVGQAAVLEAPRSSWGLQFCCGPERADPRRKDCVSRPRAPNLSQHPDHAPPPCPAGYGVPTRPP